MARLGRDAWRVLASFMAHCEALGCIPSSWRAIRQVHLGKGKRKQDDGSLLAEDLRPISVASVWWRVWSKARFRQPEVQRWLLEFIPPYMYGGVPKKGPGDALGPVLKFVDQGLCIGSLDLAKAFDYTDPKLACRIFEHVGMPKSTSTMLLSMWTRQVRHLQFFSQIRHSQVSMDLRVQGRPSTDTSLSPASKAAVVDSAWQPGG